MFEELYAPLPDVSAYLARINAPLPELTAEGLSSLIRAHHLAIPFENYNVCEFRTPVSIATEDIFEKVVRKGRGGYCFELNALFYSMLIALGFDAYPLLCRVMRSDNAHPALLHRATLVKIGGMRYYADVGLGGPAPEGAQPFADGAACTMHGRTFRLDRIDSHQWLLMRLTDNTWEPSIKFSEIPADVCDFVAPNYFCSANPQSGFALHRMANISLPNGYASIMDDTFTLCSDGKTTVRKIVSSRDEDEVLKKFFNLSIR